MRIVKLLPAGAVALAPGIATPALAADIAAGEKVFKKCKAYHVVDPAKKSKATGPNLFGVYGSAAAARRADFKYSKALKASGLTWDEVTLDKWLTKPKSLVKKTKMAFPGLKKEADRANVIAYLKTLGE